jgi:hypothetical protein
VLLFKTSRYVTVIRAECGEQLPHILCIREGLDSVLDRRFGVLTGFILGSLIILEQILVKNGSAILSVSKSSFAEPS